jgi:hypothetical protein
MFLNIGPDRLLLDDCFEQMKTKCQLKSLRSLSYRKGFDVM